MFDALQLASIPAEDEALRPKVRALIAEHVLQRPITDRVRSWMGVDAAFSRALAEAGLLGLTVPAAYGGGGRGPFARYVVVEELLAAGAPVGLHWIADRQSALLILGFGTQAQKQLYLPRICRGEIFFCIGMSEPGAGSDLASVRSRAERTEQGWRLTGQKIWTTSAHLCDYMIALVRTSGAPGDRQQGLSQLIVDLRAPGVAIRGIEDATGHRDFNEVFFDGVELPADALLGTEGAGWAQVNAELAFERSGPERIWASAVLLDGWIAHLKRSGAGEARVERVGALTTQLAALRTLSIALTARLAAGERPLTEASLYKDLGTSFEQAIPVAIADDLGSHPDEPVAPELRAALVEALALAPTYSLRGGTREILRGIIARGLGLR
ncbi:acyl-CoA dehydrogenase [Sphingomonas sp. MAH-20]|jgi:alkylation response protein AidB-like acyl-CoA dehydrogenase|uniref:Acyl-CoA dehydrogenase n=1 Tax=Sphingomonas horti TaxID=2682842 RepID=A0A6I4IW79_9SPHN|nr:MULTISPECIES: acyl-CoA dehydrogenase family protein [Sphingomonas]MBA2920157.1 acyl-CoA dehydrogenase family protein [Sphingomonas sp. CGMCC 1.13658]MVO76412.1 acyl-CoA dehydrogenase [Sphingomonas horti]